MKHLNALNEEAVRGLIQMKAKEIGLRGLARQLGLAPSYVSDVCNGRRAPGPPFLEMLGLKKVVLYVEADS